MPRPLFTPGKDPVPIVQEAGWAPGPVWTGAENLAPLPGFDPRTIQPVASHYTKHTTWPTGLGTDYPYIHTFQCMLEQTDAIMNEVLEPIMFILACPTAL